jgi:hypothetical protein
MIRQASPRSYSSDHLQSNRFPRAAIFCISVTEAEVGDAPFTAGLAPVWIGVKARRVNDWRAEDGAANPLPQSPIVCDEPEESISLIPYAAAKLRITEFPQLKS